MATRVLTVEDDDSIRTVVKLALEDEGWDVLEAGNGEDALELFRDQGADVVLIDIMLPGMNGFEVCRSIRRTTDVPIIMVTARSDTHDVVAGLEAGADDYLTKPFEPKELSARIRALLRRSRSAGSDGAQMSFGDLEVSPEQAVVLLRGEQVHLTKTEFKLLVELANGAGILGTPLELPCGVVLKNRLVKAAMSDSLGDGAGRPTNEQVALYRRWAQGGAALSLIGEVQVDHRYPEKPGNLVLGPRADGALLARLVEVGSVDDAHIWPQLGHAGALAHGAISCPAGPSSLDIEGLQCDALTRSDVDALPMIYARAAVHAQAVGFNGVEIHAGHGFLLSQFLSPLFNHRTDRYGGSIEARCQLLLAIVRQVRAGAGPRFAIAVKINSSDQLEGGLSEDEAIVAISLLGNEGIDLIEVSGGTYFPGAPASSAGRSSGPHFLEFARRARAVTDTPLMLTGGFKTRGDAQDAVATGATDLVGLARTMALDPNLPAKWIAPEGGDPEFPSFDSPKAGGITAWFTMRLTALANGTEESFDPTLNAAIEAYESRDAERVETWKRAFGT